LERLIFDFAEIAMTSKELLSELRTITDRNIDVLRQRFSNLSEQQKRWKKDTNSWSILEVFAHLNAYSSYYHPVFSNRIETTRFRDPKDNFISSPLGKSAWKSVKLGNAKNVKRRMKSPKSYNPTFETNLIQGTDIETFEKDQLHLLTILTKAEEVNLRKVKVPLSISKIIRLRLGDALQFVIYHNERHMQQALNIIENKSFPKN
jgi:uncharacterized damage-inducible protein DinB